MNSWCESCARKSCCYTMEIRPKCYLPTTNTAHGTPETYLEKSLRYSRESHEVAEQTEPSSDWICDTCKYHTIERAVQCKMCGDGGQYEPKQTEPSEEVGAVWCDNCTMEELTEPISSEKPNSSTTEDCSMVDPLHDDCFDCDKFFTCDNKGEDYKTDCPWK